jgi:VanZ family protein
MKLPRLRHHSVLWMCFFLIWFTTLWKLSSGPIPVKTGMEIPQFDKLMHFGYFFGGAGLLSAFLFCRNTMQPNWLQILTIVIISMTAIGCLDEWHQSWVPQRSGNDSQDLTADVLGALAGFHVLKKLHKYLLKA